MALLGYLVGLLRRAVHQLARLATFDPVSHHGITDHTYRRGTLARLDIRCSCGRCFYIYDRDGL